MHTGGVVKKQLGPGFTCLLEVQNSNGVIDESINRGQSAKSLKLLKLTTFQRDSEAPELQFSFKHNKGPQTEEIMSFAFGQIQKVHALFKS